MRDTYSAFFLFFMSRVHSIFALSSSERGRDESYNLNLQKLRIMEDMKTTSNELVANSYRQYSRPVHAYLFNRIDDWETARDLTQDVFLRLLDYKPMLRPETVKSFIFTIASNLLVDYWRRSGLKQEYTSYYIYDCCPKSVEDVESRVVVKDLLTLERYTLNKLSEQRRKVYAMKRFQDKDVPEIAAELQLSIRTVENHLRLGRKTVREFIRQCI